MKPRKPTKKAWEGRFTEPTDPLVEAFTVSVASDLRMAPQDIRGSIAHTNALERCAVLSKREAGTIRAGLRRVGREIAQGKFRTKPSDEDVHMAVERRLTEIVGAVGGKVHTGRSRNDQVATDFRLWLRDEIDLTTEALNELIRALTHRATVDLDVVLPGYTHLQRAQPVLLSHHWLAYVEMLLRDRDRIADCRKRLNVMPLGAGALAGAGFPIHRELIAKELDFDAVSLNSLDAVSDRDFAVEYLSTASLIAVHLSRLSEEIVLWSSEEFGFIALPDAFATGSSMMPQKKNPDVAELIRGRSGRVIGALQSLLVTLKGLPLAYNRDLQEDKPPVFDTADILRPALVILARMLPRLHTNDEAMASAAGGLSLATELADYLVEKGQPFREAHGVVGQIVGFCVLEGRGLESLSASELAGFSPLLGAPARKRLRVESALARRKLTGGTARTNVEKRLKQLRASGLVAKAPRKRK